MNIGFATYTIGVLALIAGAYLLLNASSLASPPDTPDTIDQHKFKSFRIRGAILVGLGVFLIVSELISPSKS